MNTLEPALSRGTKGLLLRKNCHIVPQKSLVTICKGGYSSEHALFIVAHHPPPQWQQEPLCIGNLLLQATKYSLGHLRKEHACGCHSDSASFGSLKVSLEGPTWGSGNFEGKLTILNSKGLKTPSPPWKTRAVIPHSSCVRTVATARLSIPERQILCSLCPCSTHCVA